MATIIRGHIFRRILPVILISLMLVGVILSVMDRSTAASPLPDVESPAAGGLQIDMLGSDTTLAGRALTFTILVTNATGLALPNVVVTDSWYLHTYNGNFQVGGGLSVVAHSFRPTATQPYIRWDLGTLAPGAAGSIVMTTDVTATLQPSTTKSAVGVPTILANAAAVATSAAGVPSANKSVNTLVVGPVMYLEKTFAPAFQRPGRLVTFTLKLTNRLVSERADSISATNTIVTEILPLKTTLWSVLPGSGVTYEYLDSARALTYTLANPVQPGQSVYVTFTARLSPTLQNAKAVVDVKNARLAFGFRSTEVTLPRLGEADVILSGNDVIEKSVQVGPPPPTAATPPRTFPNRILTYTIGVYNPFIETLSGMRLTDTLPQHPVGGPYFIYSDTLPVAPFGAPTVISIAGRTVAWDLPDIEAWGVYSFALRVRAPANFDTNGLSGREANNEIRAARLSAEPVFYDNVAPVEAKVIVVPQVVPAKTIALSSLFSGYPETYTLQLTNAGDTTITNIIVTDTLPTTEWQFEEMLFGPSPVLTTPQVVWPPITIPAYSSARLEFRVTAFGWYGGGAYCNTVAPSSPDTFIPSVKTACMQFLNPFRINKTATAPNGSVVLGGLFSYKITVLNVSFQDYAVSQICDSLPNYFHTQDGSAGYCVDYDPPAAFPANGSLSTEFDVVAESVPPNICNLLPANIAQSAGSVSFMLSGEGASWYNAVNLGPILVYPHVMLANSSELPGAAPGEPVTYTIVLTNNTSNAYTNLMISDTLPAVDASNAFEFARMAPGSTVPDPQVDGRVLMWPGLSLAPNSALRFTFIAAAAQMAGDNLENDVVVTDLSNPNTCIPWLGTGTNAKAGARVNVRPRKLEYNKTASPTSVGPFGLVQYNVMINNKGPYPVYNLVVTDVLPASIAEPYWQFNSNVSLPSGITQTSTNPPAWRIPQINYNSSVNFSFKARASIYSGGNYKNYMEGLAPNWVFTQVTNYLGAPVNITPGTALDKVASSRTAVAGDRVVYTITLYNQSGAALSSIRITDTLPAGFTYDGMTGLTSPLPDTTTPLVWKNKLPSSLNNATRLELAFYARISSTLASGTYYNQVAASAPNILIPATGDTAPVKVRGAPNVSAGKVGSPGSTYRGGTVAYTITLSNEGDDPLTVRVTDTLPAGLSYFGPLGDTPLPDSTSPTVWNSLTLDGAQSRQLSFEASVATGAPTGTVYNKVDVSSGGLRFAGTGNTAPIDISSLPTYDAQVRAVSDPPLISPGERVTYTLNYQNISADDVTLSNVMLNDTFPVNGVTYLDGSGWTEVAPGVRTLTVGSLPANASGVVTLVLQIDPSYTGEYLQNTVTITGTPPVDVLEINPANDTADAVTFVGAPPKVAIDKSASPMLVFAGEPVMYAMTLTNQSSAPLTLRVTDTMPAGFVFSRTARLTPQPKSASPLVWQNLSLPGGQALTLAWYATVTAGVTPGFYTNDVALEANGLTLSGTAGLARVETDIRRYYDLALTKSDNQTFAPPGSLVTYTLRYTNTTSDVTLAQVNLTDIITPHDYLTFLGTGWTQTAPGHYTQALPDLAPGAGNSLLVPVQIDANLPTAFLSITNTAIISAVSAMRATESNPNNNTSTDIDITRGADIAVLDMTYAPARLRQHGPITITVVFKNQGVDPTLGPDGQGWFGTELYIKPIGSPPPTGPDDHAYGKCPKPLNSCKYVKASTGDGLAPDETYTVTYSYILSLGGSQALYAQADPYWNVQGSTFYGTAQHGRVTEGDETNNIFGPIEIYAQPAVFLPLVRKS